MLSGDFQAKLRKVNKDLRIFAGQDDSKPAGIYHKNDPEVSLCGIDKNWIPEWPLINEKGKYLKGGWRRALRALIQQGQIDRRRTERVFATQILGTRRPSTAVTNYVDPIEKEIRECQSRGIEKTGAPEMKKSEIMDIASEINKCK